MSKRDQVKLLVHDEVEKILEAEADTGTVGIWSQVEWAWKMIERYPWEGDEVTAPDRPGQKG